jgi:hypothetical protein
MPRGGSKKGERRGGRVKGKPNKATIERALIAERAIAKSKAEHKPLAKEVMAEFLDLFRKLALKHQNNTRRFEKYARLTIDTAKMLAPFESPTLKAIDLPSPPPDVKGEPAVIRFGLRVFESGKLIDTDDYLPRFRRGASDSANGHSSEERDDGDEIGRT